MGNTILSGSSVWVTAADRPRWGEIWAFCQPVGAVAVHRYVGRRDGLHRFWGDGNVEADVLVEDALLVGRVVGIDSPVGPYRPVRPRREVMRASYIGARRLPRRVWYRGRAALGRLFARG